MSHRQAWVAFNTIVTREISRFTRVWMQTLLPPAITSVLYFMIFGHVIGKRIGEMDGVSYIQFIVPGLILMQVITSAYANVVSSFFGSKFQRSIEELMISPTSNAVILIGFVVGGILRGLMVAAIVTVIALAFTHLAIHHIFVIIGIIVMSAMLFSLMGFTNAVFAQSFDDISIIPTFVLTPLTYLGGVFYSIHLLPAFWEKVSLFNPILYMVNTFRYGILGVSDINTSFAFAIVFAFIVILFAVNMVLLHKGIGMRS